MDAREQRILNVSFSAKRADVPGDVLYTQQYLQERVYLRRHQLAKLTTLHVLPFDDTLCVREPCLNFEECLSVLKFGNASDFIESATLLFRPIRPVSTFACRCPRGFTGKNRNCSVTFPPPSPFTRAHAIPPFFVLRFNQLLFCFVWFCFVSKV